MVPPAEMCIELLSQVFRMDMRPHGKKWVFACFADAANPDGMTWIAVQSERGKLDLMQKTCMGERAVQGHIKALEEEGHLERFETPGKGCLWIVRITPAKSAGLLVLTPAENSETPAENAGEPFLTVKGKEKADRVGPPVDKCPLSHQVLPPGLSLQQWEAFLDMRFALGKAVKPYVAAILIRKLTGIAKRWVAGDVVDRSTVNGWPDLYEPEEGRVTGVRRVTPSGHIADPVGGFTDEDKAELARIAALRETDPHASQVAAKDYFARKDARNSPASIGQLVGELPLMAAVKRQRRKGSAR
jgi:hypothetical protein